MNVIKRGGSSEPFNKQKIINALNKAFIAVGQEVDNSILEDIANDVEVWEDINIEDIQDQLEELLEDYDFHNVAKEFMIYRAKRSEERFEEERLDYMEEYSRSHDNAATSSETDANANVTMKNVANLEGEVYKTKNRRIQRRRMRKKLKIMFPELSDQYEKDLNNHIIYTHDEASTPTIKQYCMAVSLYPLMVEGVGNIDGVTPSKPDDLRSFSGQVTNLTFLLSSQCKGAVAFGEYFIALNYYIIIEFGEDWYNKLDDVATTSVCKKVKTVKDIIYEAFKQFI
jgi:ribonucleoside-triphosphate reductase